MGRRVGNGLKFKCRVNCPFKVSRSATANLKFGNRPSPEHAVLRARSVLHHLLSAPTYPVMQGDHRGVHTWWSLPLRLGISFEEEAFESWASEEHTHQSVKLGDTYFIRIHHAELLPGHQVQSELPGTHEIIIIKKKQHTHGEREVNEEPIVFKERQRALNTCRKWHVYTRAVRSSLSVGLNKSDRSSSAKYKKVLCL